MKSIKFSENELEFLKNHYEFELADAENYVSEIKNILTKLNKLEKPGAAEKAGKKTGKKRGRPKKEQKAVEEIPAPVKEAPVKAPKEAAVKSKPRKAKTKKRETKKPSPKKNAINPRKTQSAKVVNKAIPENPSAEGSVS